ncbi:hypothetical protein D1831_10205 [Lactiplantibacillus garii]|uniref:DUF4097 domain-containing protein n=1 Tax=Lactiplantibacillus garii TaxID=2306423 RepID=A0A426D5S4_9LACO|nr:DUF4097 family beta strand repeat-containing protein [Lactiplantibacillus garii]RRK09921.1 hypothetical protein D1831_10205 [Lactiplantibacillus garii]
MRKTVKVGVILLVLGVIMLIFGIANNGIQSVYWEKGFKVVKTHEKTYQPKKITDITLSSNEDVVIERGDVATIKVTTTRKLADVEINNGHVTISSSSPTATSDTVGYMFNDGSESNRIVITIPKRTTVNWIKDTDKQFGDVNVQNVTAKHVQLLNGNGDVRLSSVNIKNQAEFSADTLHLTDVTAPTLKAKGSDVTISDSHFNDGASKVQSNDGDIKIGETQFKTAKVHSDDGDIRLNQNHVTSLSATTDDGDIHLSANKRVGVYAQTDDGDLSIFGYRSDTDQSYHYNKTAKQQYHLTSGDGDVTATAA